MTNLFIIVLIAETVFLAGYTLREWAETRARHRRAMERTAMLNSLAEMWRDDAIDLRAPS